jgi:hypothetical protein
MASLKTLAVLAVAAILFSGCLKDPIPDPLDSNPFDSDYQGPALIEFESANTTVLLNNLNVPVDTVLRIVVRVRTDRFPKPTLYSVVFTNEQNGAVSTLPLGEQPTAFYEIHHVDAGTQYCIGSQLRVQFVNTRKWIICATATL